MSANEISVLASSAPPSASPRAGDAEGGIAGVDEDNRRVTNERSAVAGQIAHLRKV